MTQPAPKVAKPPSRAAQAAGVVAAAFVPYLPYTKVLSSESNRRLMFYTREDALALFALIAATIAVFGLAWAALTKVPGRAGIAARRIAVAGAIGLALLNLMSLYHPIGTDAGYAMNYGVLGLLVIAIALWGRTYKVFAGVSGVAARILAPAPVVFTVFLFGVETYPAATSPSPPHQPTEAVAQGPVYFFLFDAMDAGIAIRDPRSPEHAPHLHDFLRQATYFEQAASPAAFTSNSVPGFLFQAPGYYDIQDGVYYLILDDKRTPTEAMPSIFEKLDTGSTFTVVGGWYLDYKAMLGNRVDWIRTSSYVKPFSRSFAESVRFSAAQATVFGFVPLLRGVSGVDDLSFYPHVQNTREIHDHALDVIKTHGDDVVAFFHYPVPHAPYLFGRDGPLPYGKVLASRGEEAYRSNLEYADTLLGELLTAIRQTGRWEKATIVIMSDHGLHNYNCVFVAKMPGQSSPVTVSEKLNTARFLDWLASERHPRLR